MASRSSGEAFSKRVLLVDDDDTLRLALQHNLEKLRYDVYAVPNVKLAQAHLAREPVDAIISGIGMAEGGGLELARNLQRQPSIPMLLITGFSHLLETEEAYRLGVQEFLTRPFARDELAAALARSLTRAAAEVSSRDADYCRIGIDDFASGRFVRHQVFVRLANRHYVKIAPQGEDLSPERIRRYKAEGIRFLYLRREDFQKYLGFGFSSESEASDEWERRCEQRLDFIGQAVNLLNRRRDEDGLEDDLFDGAAPFIETAIEAMLRDPGLFALLQRLRSQGSASLAHCLGVCLYGLLIARAVSWHLPANKFKVAMAGLLHDVGHLEMPRELFRRPHGEWGEQELRIYAQHPWLGAKLLSGIPTVSPDVVRIVREHHEDCLAEGFPARLKRCAIHPMAKLIAVADAFCMRVVPGDRPGVSPREALQQMSALMSDRLEPQFFGALKRLFDFPGSTN